MVPRERADAQRLPLDWRRSRAPRSLWLGVVVTRKSDRDSAQSERPAAGFHRKPREAVGTARGECPKVHRAQSVERRQRRAAAQPTRRTRSQFSPATISSANTGTATIVVACLGRGTYVGT